MTTYGDVFALADWRRTITETYASVRKSPAAGRLVAWQDWRAVRNDLFKTHSQSPLDDEQRERFSGLSYFEYDPEWRIVGRIKSDVKQEVFNVYLPAEGEFHYRRVGEALFDVGGDPARLSLFWVESYGGGLFLPFRDASNGVSTYGGGRYLFDGIKGVDLGVNQETIILDFNYAYNPSCAYHPRWVCPLSPSENNLLFAVSAGEKLFEHSLRD